MKRNRNITGIIILLIMIAYPYAKMLISSLLKGKYALYQDNVLAFTYPEIIHLIALAAAAYAAINETTVKQVAIVKFSHIPYYVVHLSGLVGSAGLSELPLYLLYDIMIILISGVYMLGVERAKVIHKVFGFIYILDIIAVVQLLYIRKKGDDEV